MPASRRSLSRNCNRLPRVIDSLVGLRRWLDSHAVAFFDKNDSKRTTIQSSREFSLAVTDRQFSIGVIPFHRNSGVGAFFVGIGIVLVFIKSEAAIGPGVDAQFDGIRRFLCRPLQIWPHGDNGSGTNVKWNAIQRSLRFNCGAAVGSAARPEV